MKLKYQIKYLPLLCLNGIISNGAFISTIIFNFSEFYRIDVIYSLLESCNFSISPHAADLKFSL
jgi:hypothetical protein